jgi:hypothetical protein
LDQEFKKKRLQSDLVQLMQILMNLKLKTLSFLVNLKHSKSMPQWVIQKLKQISSELKLKLRPMMNSDKSRYKLFKTSTMLRN